jgi:hypothetical protein
MGSCVSGTYVVRAILRRIPRVSRLGVREQNGKRVKRRPPVGVERAERGGQGSVRTPEGPDTHTCLHTAEFIQMRRACVLTGGDVKRCGRNLHRAHAHSVSPGPIYILETVRRICSDIHVRFRTEGHPYVVQLRGAMRARRMRTRMS